MQRSLLTEALQNCTHVPKHTMKVQDVKKQIQKPKNRKLDTIYEVEMVEGQGTPPIDIPSSVYVKQRLAHYETMRRERVLRRLWYGV